MKRKLLALLLAAVMALQVSGLSVFAEEVGELVTEPAGIENPEQAEEPGEAVFNFSAAKYVLSEGGRTV